MSPGATDDPGGTVTANWVIWPLSVIRPTLSPFGYTNSVNHTLLSGPAVSAVTPAISSGTGNVVIWPLVVIRPMAGLVERTGLPEMSPELNQTLPSDPAVITPGPSMGEGNSVTWPLGVMRPTACAPGSANHTLPSGPAVMAVAPKLPPRLSGGRANSVIVDGTKRPSSAVTCGRMRRELAVRSVLRRNGKIIAGS